MLLEESYVYSQSGLLEALPSKPDKIVISGEYAIESIRDLFSKEDKDNLYINKKLKAYKVESINNGQLVLKFKQLDY